MGDVFEGPQRHTFGIITKLIGKIKLNSPIKNLQIFFLDEILTRDMSLHGRVFSHFLQEGGICASRRGCLSKTMPRANAAQIQAFGKYLLIKADV